MKSHGAFSAVLKLVQSKQERLLEQTTQREIGSSLSSLIVFAGNILLFLNWLRRWMKFQSLWNVFNWWGGVAWTRKECAILAPIQSSIVKKEKSFIHSVEKNLYYLRVPHSRHGSSRNICDPERVSIEQNWWPGAPTSKTLNLIHRSWWQTTRGSEIPRFIYRGTEAFLQWWLWFSSSLSFVFSCHFRPSRSSSILERPRSRF